MAYNYVAADDFTPESNISTPASDRIWQPIGKVKQVIPPPANTSGDTVERFTLEMESGHLIIISFLSPLTFRVRFNPDRNAEYRPTRSPATVNDRIDITHIEHNAADELARELRIFTGQIEIRVNKTQYALSVYRGRGEQLIHADLPNYNLVYIEGAQVIANFKRAPQNARYFGFGEKAGATLDKKQVPVNHFYPSSPERYRIGSRLTFFNYDNYHYADRDPRVVPENEEPGSLNPNIPLYQSSPFLMEYNPAPQGDFAGAPYCYGLLFDNTSQSYLNLYDNNYYYFGALYGELDYYFFAGGDAAGVLSEFTQLTGRTCLKPKYVFGYHQGGYGIRYNRRELLLQRAREYRERQIPIDGLHIDIDLQDNYRTFTNSPKNFPDPKGMLDELHQMGYKCSTNITPYISNDVDENGGNTPYATRDSGLAENVFVIDRRVDEDGSVIKDSNEPFIGAIWYGGDRGGPGYYPDFGSLRVQEWWGNQYQSLVNWGMDMIWQDMTTPAMDERCGERLSNPGNFSQCFVYPDELPLRSFPLGVTLFDNEESRYLPNPFDPQKQPFAKIHNLYNYNLVRATFYGLQKLRSNKRNFIIARGGFVGVHRFAGLWTGDNQSDWNFLKITIPQVLNMGLSGQSVCGSDVGGFSGARPSAELLVRWTILGTFIPWFRNHYENYNPDSEKRTKGQEPYAYENENPAVVPMCRKYIELRYQLIQVLYDLMYENHLTGKPIIRPLFFNEMDPQVFEDHGSGFFSSSQYQNSRLDDQFFVGKDILVCPVVVEGQNNRPVYLPGGSQWYVFKNNIFRLDEPVNGGVEFEYNAPWDNYQQLDFMNNIPIYIRDGAIIPMREVEQYVGQLHSEGKPNPITFNIYPGRDSTYQLYLDDDGETRNAEERSQYRLTQVSHTAIVNGQRIRFERTQDNYNPFETFFYVSLLGSSAPTQVVAGVTKGTPVTLTSQASKDALAAATQNSYYYDLPLQTIFIKIFDNNPDLTIEVTF